MKKTKILAVLISALLLTGSLVGCLGDNEDIEGGSDVQGTEQGTPSDGVQEGTGAEPATEGISAYEWKHADDEVMFTLDGKDIDFATYRYYAMNFKGQYDGGDDTYWNEETEAQFKGDMLSEFKKLAAIEKLSVEKGVPISEADIASINDYVEQFKAIYGEDLYKQQLDLFYFTEDVYLNTNKYNYMLENLYTTYAGEEEILKYANENYVHVKHVLIGTLDEEGNEYTGEVFDEKTALANDIAKRAKDGEDFDALVKEYGEDPGMEQTPEGYTFTYGMMVPEFEAKSFELKEGEISEPVKTSYGYHIIQKLPIDREALMDDEKQTYWEIVSAIAASPAEAEVAKCAETIEIVETDAFKSLTMANIGKKK